MVNVDTGMLRPVETFQGWTSEPLKWRLSLSLAGWYLYPSRGHSNPLLNTITEILQGSIFDIHRILNHGDQVRNLSSLIQSFAAELGLVMLYI